MKTITVEEGVWRRLTALKIKHGFKTISGTVKSLLTILRVHKMEDELVGGKSK